MPFSKKRISHTQPIEKNPQPRIMTSLKQTRHEAVVALMLVGGGDDVLVGQGGPGREEEVVGLVDQVGHR